MPSSDESTNNSIPEIIINNTEDSSVAESSSPHIQASLNDPSSLHLPPEDTHHGYSDESFDPVSTSAIFSASTPNYSPQKSPSVPVSSFYSSRQSSSIDNKFGEESAALNYSDDFEYESDFDYESDFEELSGSRASTGKNTLSGSSASIGNYASIRTDEEVKLLSVCDARNADEAMHILESDHTTVYTTLLKRLKGTPPPLPAKKREINVDVDAQKYLLDRLKNCDEREKRRVKFSDETSTIEMDKDEMEVPRRIVENLRLKNLLKRMETAGTLPEEHLLNPTLRQSERQRTHDLQEITALRHLNARVRYRTLQREVDDERFYKWGIEGSIVQKDHIAMIAGILEDMPRLCDGRDEIWRRLLERVRK